MAKLGDLKKIERFESLSRNDINKARLVSKYAQEYCLMVERSDIKPRELLPYLVKKVVYNQVDQRNGSYLRELLRKLDDAGKLDLIPQVTVERKTKNRYWSFRAV